MVARYAREEVVALRHDRRVRRRALRVELGVVRARGQRGALLVGHPQVGRAWRTGAGGWARRRSGGVGVAGARRAATQPARTSVVDHLERLHGRAEANGPEVLKVVAAARGGSPLPRPRTRAAVPQSAWPRDSQVPIGDDGVDRRERSHVDARRLERRGRGLTQARAHVRAVHGHARGIVGSEACRRPRLALDDDRARRSGAQHEKSVRLRALFMCV